jgi:hypothetical protein
MDGKKKAQTQVDRTEPSERPHLAPPPLGINAPHVVYPGAVYTVEDLRRVFGLKASSVRREVRLRRLRIAKRCGRYYCLGQWVLQWFGDGELRPQPRSGEGKAGQSEQDGQRYDGGT